MILLQLSIMLNFVIHYYYYYCIIEQQVTVL